MSLLAGKVIVIVGGTTGLGRSAAAAFVSAGAQVVVVGRNPDNVAAAVAALGDASRGHCGDACDPATARAAIELAVDQFGGFSGLYHVAGGSGRRFGDGPLHEITDEGWAQTLQLNLTSVFYSNRAAVEWFRSAAQPGSILNCGSVLGFSPSARHFGTHAYAAAKSALLGFSKSCAATYAREGIRFNVVAPALVATPMSQRAQENEAIMAFARAKQPLAENAIGQAEDVDGIAVYLMSDQSRGVTGQVMSVDWGWAVSDAIP
jgi:NAD(P)-dependent dehydrogenase (short-subunit alcohol dehydrogenase family)